MKTKKVVHRIVMSFAAAILLAGQVEAATDREPVTERPAAAVKKFAVCVFCGASDQADPKFAATAREVGRMIAQHGWVLVWGGAKTGLMGAVARGAKENGGQVFGVIPEFIKAWEVGFDAADELVTVTTMSERKIFLQSRADAFVILPGGLGTLDEIADTLELRQLDRHQKPILLLNQDGYYDKLIEFIDEGVRARFNRAGATEKFTVVKNVEMLASELDAAAAKRVR